MLIFAFHAIHVIAIETWNELSGMAGKKETTEMEMPCIQR